MQHDTVLLAIQAFCNSSKSRQRSDLYTYLNKTLGIELDVYDYDGRNDHARFACDYISQKHEADYVLAKLAAMESKTQ